MVLYITGDVLYRILEALYANNLFYQVPTRALGNQSPKWRISAARHPLCKRLDSILHTVRGPRTMRERLQLRRVCVRVWGQRPSGICERVWEAAPFVYTYIEGTLIQEMARIFQSQQFFLFLESDTSLPPPSRLPARAQKQAN